MPNHFRSQASKRRTLYSVGSPFMLSCSHPCFFMYPARSCILSITHMQEQGHASRCFYLSSLSCEYPGVRQTYFLADMQLNEKSLGVSGKATNPNEMIPVHFSESRSPYSIPFIPWELMKFLLVHQSQVSTCVHKLNDRSHVYLSIRPLWKYLGNGCYKVAHNKGSKNSLGCFWHDFECQ